MADIQSRYQAIPYGWREIDIAAVAALLICQQKVTIKYGGATIQPDNDRLPDLLRKKSEIGKVSISKRTMVSAIKMKQVKDVLRKYFDQMDVPGDEDGLIRFIVEKFQEQKNRYEELDARYAGKTYPDRGTVSMALELIKNVLSQQKDNTALIDRILQLKVDLGDSKEDMGRVEEFFQNQAAVFDRAVQFEADLRNDLDYIKTETEANDALNQIRLIVMVNARDAGYVYRRIPELNGLMEQVRQAHDRLLEEKRENLREIIRQCMESIHTAAAGGSPEARAVSDKADVFFDQQRERLKITRSLALLDGLVPPMWQYQTAALDRIQRMDRPAPPKPADGHEPPARRVIKSLYRQTVFPAGTLESEADIDAYLDKIRAQLKQFIQDCDGIKLN